MFRIARISSLGETRYTRVELLSEMPRGGAGTRSLESAWNASFGRGIRSQVREIAATKPMSRFSLMVTTE